MVDDHRTVSPGIIRLAALIEQHGEAIEADLAYRGIDLRELWRGDLTYRRLAVLVAALPAESLTKTAIRDGMSARQLAAAPRRAGFGPWSNSELLLALIADRLGVVVWQNGGRKTAPRPEPIPRPGVASSRREITPAGVAYLADMRARRNRELGREVN